jgi:hypothetical protein
MSSITSECRISGTQFVISDEDQAMLSKLAPCIGGNPFEYPLPTLSPLERQRRRMAFRNDHALYHRKCDKTGKQIISLYDIDSPFTIYNVNLWWGDEWDPLDYGRDFDLSRSFFEQFAELQRVVPRLAMNGAGNENCEYTSYVGWSRNCYLTFTADRNEDCYFGAYASDNKDCCDFLFTFDSELCYEVIDCKNCYHCLYSYNLENCSDCILSRDLIGSQNCFGSIGLRNKQYHFFNEPLSKEEYETRLKALRLDTYSGLMRAKTLVKEFFLTFPHKALEIKGSENVQGDHIKFSRNCYSAYDIDKVEDCRYVSHFINSKDCMDFDYYGDGSELCYEISSSVDLKSSFACINSWQGNSELLYCELMSNSKNCFGSIGLRNAQYCIFNKQYTKDAYEALLPQIIEHMRQTGEWGEFFPAQLSPYAYNETVAQDYLPLSKEEVLTRGLKWKEKKEKTSYQGPEIELLDSIADVDESICKEILLCEETGDPYKIIPQELKFYKKWKLPLPRRSPNQRYLDRMGARNPRKWWKRPCGNCKKEIFSTYDSERPELIYCEDCYRSKVY